MLFLSSKHLGSWGDHGDGSPLGRYLGESPSSAAVLPPSKAATLGSYSKKGHLLVWWGTAPSPVSFERKEGVDTMLMPLWWGHDGEAAGGDSLQPFLLLYA